MRSPSHQSYVLGVNFTIIHFTAGCVCKAYAQRGICYGPVSVCPSVCLKAGVWSKWMDASSWFPAQRLSSTFLTCIQLSCTLCFKGIRLSTSGTWYHAPNSKLSRFLADVNLRSRSLYAIARPSVVCLSSVCNVDAPYSAGCNFRQFFSSYDSPGTLVFWCQKLLVGDAPFPLKFALKVTHPPY